MLPLQLVPLRRGRIVRRFPRGRLPAGGPNHPCPPGHWGYPESLIPLESKRCSDHSGYPTVVQ
eukprot:14642305-Alexandrium_andersonii.AAC.1